jgi:hypothetical protein
MSETVEMIHAQDCTLILLNGKAYSFKKMQPVTVQKADVEFCMQKGAALVDLSEAPKTQVEETKPLTAADREAAIITAIKAVVAKNDPEEFDANGQPRVPVLTEVCGFKVDTQDRNVCWKKYKELKGGDT